MKNQIAVSADNAQSVNFREICMGNISRGTLYRSSHPIKDNVQERAIALLAANARIASVINLSDTDSDLKTKVFFAPWYSKLYRNKRVITLGMDFNNTGDNYNRKLKKGLQFIINTEGPWLIHCHAGVDRTGFFSMVLESLMGASVKEIACDYLMSFNSIFDSSIYNINNKNDLMIVMQLLSVICGQELICDENLQHIAGNYLEHTIGLTVLEIESLKRKLSGT